MGSEDDEVGELESSSQAYFTKNINMTAGATKQSKLNYPLETEADLNNISKFSSCLNENKTLLHHKHQFVNAAEGNNHCLPQESRGNKEIRSVGKKES